MKALQMLQTVVVYWSAATFVFGLVWVSFSWKSEKETEEESVNDLRAYVAYIQAGRGK